MKLALMSDTHGAIDNVYDVVPPCDILVHAGDICPDSYRRRWTSKEHGLAASWLQHYLIPAVDALIHDGIIKHFVATLGNHDFVTRQEARMLSNDNIHFLIDETKEIMGKKFHGSPWSNQFMNWAWMHEPDHLATIYERIPDDVDILISHQPPLGFGSLYENYRTGETEDIGSEELAAELARIKPKLVVCGHIHTGYGTYTHPLGFPVVNAALKNEQYILTNPIEVVEL